MATTPLYESGSQSPCWESDIQDNLSELTESITNLDKICIKLIQQKLISFEEMETIKNESTGSNKNLKLLYTLKSKNWSRVKSIFLQILRETNNEHCADIIESSSANQPSTSSKRKTTGNEISSNKKSVSKPLNSKWWPEKKLLPNSFYERKNENELYTEKLKRLLTENANKTTVINQKVAVSGLGGIGKSTTAKWFAQQYEEDYDFILWIDCGEGSLLKSFTSLARMLEVKDRLELELKELAAGCFELLKGYKCLFIYDNAECYVGVEGIRDVLPISYSKFHVIITSRNREWGNESGLGQIPEFQLDVFGKNEALEFTKKNLKIHVDEDEPKLEKLCESLGNLPLALQIAVATLNQHKISLIEYIERINNTPHIILATFDDYEKTINKTMQISLNLIQSHERNLGGLAYRILIYFGYITPDDVELKLIESVEMECNYAEIIEATQLLESYSLIASKSIPSQEHQFSIHRLLQQVIRHITSESKNEILKQILNCKGFLEYKLIPFSYAGQQLQKKFSKIKAELIDKFKLNKLLKERKFREAVELSRLINDKLNNLTSRFNYGVCLKYNSDERKSMEVFESLFQELKENFNDASKDKSYYKEYFNYFGNIRDRNKELTLEVILGQILLNAKYKEEANKLFLHLKRVILPPRTPLNEIVTFLNSRSFYNCELRYLGEEHYVSLSIENEGHSKKLDLASCIVDKNFLLPKDLQELTLREAKFIDGKMKWNVPKLNLIETDFVQNTPEITVHEMTIKKSKVDIYLLPQSLQKLTLDECILVKNAATVTSNISPLPHLQNVQLSFDYGIKVEDSMGVQLKHFDVSHLLSPSLVKLRIVRPDNSRLYVPLNSLKLIQDLHLEGCILIVPHDVIPIAPQVLSLMNVHIRDEEKKYHSSQLVNNFINFSHMQTLDLRGMSIDLSEDVTIDQVRLSAMKQVVNGESAKWKINKLKLDRFDDFSRTEIRVKEMTIRNSEMDISHLPQTLEKLILGRGTFISCAASSDGKNVPNCWPSCLQQLEIEHHVTFLDVDRVRLKEFNISATLPPSLYKLSLDCYGSTRLLVCLNNLQSMDVLQLRYCDLVVFPTFPAVCIAPKELLLQNVNIIDGITNTKIDIPVNDFIDFNQMQKLKLEGQIVDFVEPLKIVDVNLRHSKLINWESGSWTVEVLSIWPDPGPTTNIIKKKYAYNYNTILLESEEIITPMVGVEVTSKKKVRLRDFIPPMVPRAHQSSQTSARQFARACVKRPERRKSALSVRRKK